MSASKVRPSWFLPPVLTRGRILFAMAVALTTDALQVLLGPLGWAFTDEVLDVIALILTSRAIGFHPLLLPTFLVEFMPVVDLLPTWTGCTSAVILLRRKAGPAAPPIEAAVVSQPAEPRPHSRQPGAPPLLTIGEENPGSRFEAPGKSTPGG